MDIVESINNVPIRLTDERWVHIVENHNDLAGYYDQILETVESPDFVVQGYRDALIALRKVTKNFYLAVVYKEIDEEDGFIITAYKTSTPKKEVILWKKH